MGYILTDETKDLLADVKKFCDNEVKEQCKAYDVSGEWPKEIYDKAVEMGLGALEVPEEYGGIGLDEVSCAALYEEMAKADAGFFTTFVCSNLALKPIFIAGTEEQKQWACDILLEGGYGAFCLTEPMAGSDAANSKTTAVKDGGDYVINGRKCFITNAPVADFFVVAAMTDKTKGVKGMSIFLIPKDTKGLSTTNHENKMGIRTSITSDVVLEDLRVPASAMIGEEGTGFITCMKTLDMARTFIGIGAVGVMQRAIEEAVAYSKTRVTFGKPIGKFQSLQFMIADMEIKCETSPR
jgi:butyryl-CoA dehydrogenase